MPIDPRVIPTSIEQRDADQRADLDRRMRALAHPGAQAAADIEAETIASSLVGYEVLGGPDISLLVPEGGAFVQLYAEMEMRVTAGAVEARATIFEPTDFAAGITLYLAQSGGAFVLRRQGAAVAGNSGSPGVLLTYWATAGARAYSLRYGVSAAGSAEFRNRRLWGRVMF